MSAIVQALAELVAMPTPNPPGNTSRIAQYVLSLLDQAGFAMRSISVHGEGVNVLAETGSAKGPTVMFHVHMDTGPAGQLEAGEIDATPGAAER